jgi:adenosylcobinamide-phosphate synthase
MGNWLTKGRHLAPSRHRFWFGVGWITAGIALFAWPWWKIGSMPIIASAIFLKPVFAYRNLRQNIAEVAQALTLDDLPTARHLAGWHLVSRDTNELTAEEVAGAAIESLAENMTDSLTAPLTAYVVGGLPAAWAYRFVNTADAMWGYRTAEFEQLGKFPARLDDILNWLPARLTAWLLVAAAWLAGENAAQAKRAMLSQHHQTSSPNAGWTMSTMAGALGVTLSKRDAYQLVGGEAKVAGSTIRRALRIADIGVGLTVISLVILSTFKILFINRRSRP